MPKIKITKRHGAYYYLNQNSDSIDEQNDHYNQNLQPSENWNADLQYDQIRAVSDTRHDDKSILKSTQNNHANYQPRSNCHTDLKQVHDCLPNCQCAESSAAIASPTQSLQIENCFNDEEETLQNSADLQKTQNLKPENLSFIKNETYNDSNLEGQNAAENFQQDDNHPSSSHLEENLSIRTTVCNMDSESKKVQDFDKLSELENDLRIIKSEPCDINSSVSENTKETHCFESLEYSNKACDPETDHSNCSAIVEGKTEKPDADSSLYQDLKRSRRNSKRKRDLEDQCPVCGVTVRCSDFEGHFTKEVESLSNIAKNVRKTRTPYKDREGFRCGVNLAFLQAKTNRENRNAARKAKFMIKRAIDCPVCNIKITGTDEEINDHVLSCFGEDDESDINITDYDENFEEFEIGNETRVRAISLVPGGHRSLHGYASKSRPADDYEGDLNVDVDDTMEFGKPQYTELDVIHNTVSASDEREREQLRRAVISDPSAEPHVIESKKWSQNFEIQNEVNEITNDLSAEPCVIQNRNWSQNSEIQKEINEITNSCMKAISKEEKNKENEAKDPEDERNIQKTDSCIISSLKERIKDLEEQKNVKCLICLDVYTRPVVSTACWHVHCEECWLVSMGVKKLCPQCNMIVFPTDLRRIYL